MEIKGSLDQIHFIFEVNVGKNRIRHKKDSEFWIAPFSESFELHQFLSRCMSDPTHSDIDFKNKMAKDLDYP